MSDEIKTIVNEALHETLEELGFKGNHSIAMPQINVDEECRRLASAVYGTTQSMWVPHDQATDCAKLIAFRDKVRALAKEYL